MKTLTRIAVLLAALAALLLGSAGVANAMPAPEPVMHGVMKDVTSAPCEQEDSLNCYWDAKERVNGEGHSFYSIRVGHLMCTVYWGRAYNLKHGHCGEPGSK